MFAFNSAFGRCKVGFRLVHIGTATTRQISSSMYYSLSFYRCRRSVIYDIIFSVAIFITTGCKRHFVLTLDTEKTILRCICHESVTEPLDLVLVHTVMVTQTNIFLCSWCSNVNIRTNWKGRKGFQKRLSVHNGWVVECHFIFCHLLKCIFCCIINVIRLNLLTVLLFQHLCQTQCLVLSSTYQRATPLFSLQQLLQSVLSFHWD